VYQESLKTRNKKSIRILGKNNPFFGKGPGIVALNKAAYINGTKIYVYNANNISLVEGSPFRSIRIASKSLPISANTLSKVLDTGKIFKNYYYYSKAK
jgi:group I intron endonuclease